jgi:hypothetical protein
MSFPSSAIGLPVGLDYKLAPSLPESARSFSVNVSPDGITSVTGGTLPAATFVANNSGSFGAFSSQVVSFTIPSGMSDSVFMDPTATSLSFTLTYTIGTASAGATGGYLNLVGSGASFWDQLVLYSNNVPIETIGSYGLLQNFLLQNTVNQAERYGGLSIACGADTNSGNGIELAHSATGSYRYNFTIPLLSVIGASSDKLIPIGSIGNMQLQMTTANLLPFVSYCTAITTQPALTGNFVLSEFTLNMKYIDVGDMAAALLKQTLVDGKWFIKSQTYTNSAVSIPSGSSGSQQLLLQIRNTSVKSIIHQFGIGNTDATSAAVSPNGYYDAFNPALNVRQCQIGGFYYPNKSINDLQRPSEGYQYLIAAMAQGGSITKAYGTVVTRDMYNAVLPSVPAGSDTFCVVPAAALRPAPSGTDGTSNQIAKWPNGFYCGYDLEKCSGTLFQGVNTRNQPPFLNLNMAVASNRTITCQAWGISDVILSIDTVAKQVQAFI